jgi:hypothetical protein
VTQHRRAFDPALLADISPASRIRFRRAGDGSPAQTCRASRVGISREFRGIGTPAGRRCSQFPGLDLRMTLSFETNPSTTSAFFTRIAGEAKRGSS